jgi:hypothetical protein
MILCAPAHPGIGDPQIDRYILQNGASQGKKSKYSGPKVVEEEHNSI